MFANRFMRKHPATVELGTRVHEAIDRMREAGTHILPVVDREGRVRGELTSYDLLRRIVPEYIASGDLTDASFAPDIGVLARQYREMRDLPVERVMNDSPLLIREDESLLAVTADLVSSHGRHDYVLVVDGDRHLLGIISPRDILERLRRIKLDEAHERG